MDSNGSPSASNTVGQSLQTLVTSCLHLDETMNTLHETPESNSNNNTIGILNTQSVKTNLASNSDGRRQILQTLIESALRGDKLAKNTTRSSIKSIQAINTREANILLNSESNLSNIDGNSENTKDETLEVVRLLLLANKHTNLNYNYDIEARVDDFIDAENIFSELVGCGPLSPAIAKALMLYKSRTITATEVRSHVFGTVCLKI